MLKLQYFSHLMQRADSLEKTLIWERLRTGGEKGDRGWDGWMESPTQRTCCVCLVAQSCPTFCDPMDCSTLDFPVLHYLPELAQTHVCWVSEAIQPSHPLLPPSPPALFFPSIRVFFNESVLCIRWPKYWSFSISPSNEYSALISCRIDWFDLAVQGTLESLPCHMLWKKFSGRQLIVNYSDTFKLLLTSTSSNSELCLLNSVRPLSSI